MEALRNYLSSYGPIRGLILRNVICEPIQCARPPNDVIYPGAR